MKQSEKVKQMGVGLPEPLRHRLASAADAAGHSIAAEIRQRLERTFEQDAADEQTREFLDAIGHLATWVRLQTNHAWHSHPAAHWVFRNAITSRLQRLRPAGERVFADGELPKALLVATTEPEAMGLGLEAIEFHQREQMKDPRVQERVKAVREKTLQEIRKTQKETGK